MRDGTFTDDFRPDMERERRALESTACGTYERQPDRSPRRLVPQGPFEGAWSPGSEFTILPDDVAAIANEAILVGLGRVPLKNLAERLERFGVRRKA